MENVAFTNDRVFEYKGWKIISKDPYGLWSVEGPLKGTAKPAELRGEFTGKNEAMLRIDRVINKKVEESK